jgi:hypothetical protein
LQLRGIAVAGGKLNMVPSIKFNINYYWIKKPIKKLTIDIAFFFAKEEVAPTIIIIYY